MFKYEEFDEKIKKLFNEQELKEIFDKSSMLSNRVLILILDIGFIEIAADIRNDKLEMTFLEKNADECIVVDKEEVLKIVRNSEIKKINCLNIDE